MRKTLLAMAALMGVATLPAHAWRVKVDDQTFADIGFSTMIRGIYEGKRTNNTAEKSRLNFYVPLTNITAGGQVNNLVYFFINAESGGAQNGFITRDSFIGMKFADEFRLQAGWQRAPFSRAALTSTYTLLVPTPHASRGLAVDPTNVQSKVGSPRDAGVVVWGNVAGGMLKYYLGVTDGATIGSSTDDSLAYTVRLQFTPTMLGFKGETGYGLSDTYLGNQDVMSIGVGYRVVGRDVALQGFPADATQDTKMWTLDLLYEQKFGDIVPNVQLGYISMDDANGVNNQKATHLYVQGQVLFNQMVGFGKPAVAVKFEQNKNDLPAPAGDPKNTRFSIWGHYYIKGQAAKVSLGIDSVSLNDEAKTIVGNGKNFTDLVLQFQTQF